MHRINRCLRGFHLHREKSKITDWLVVILTLLIAGAAFWSAWIFQGQLIEARRATEIQERPWLSVEAKPMSELMFVNSQQPAFKLRFSIKNVGHSIAKTIHLDVKMFPTSVSLPVSLDAAQHQRELCEHPHLGYMGDFDLFPMDQPTERDTDISAAPDAIASQAVSIQGNKTRKFFGLYIVGCVSYRYSFGASIHQTRFAYHLVRPIPPENGKFLALPDGTPLIMGFELGLGTPIEAFSLMQEFAALNDAN